MSKTPWFAPTGVLHPDKHEKLIANRHGYAQDAGIPQELLWRPLPALAPGVKDWIARFKQHRSEGYCGLLLTGSHPTLDPLSQVGAIAGCPRHTQGTGIAAVTD